MAVEILSCTQRYAAHLCHGRRWYVYWSRNFDELSVDHDQEMIESFDCPECAEEHAARHRDRTFHERSTADEEPCWNHIGGCRDIIGRKKIVLVDSYNATSLLPTPPPL